MKRRDSSRHSAARQHGRLERVRKSTSTAISAAPIQYLDVLVREFDREPAYPGYVGFRPVECLT